MIKTLRIRFILTAIASVFLVLAVLVGGINIFNYRKVVSDSDDLLKILSDNGGSFPEIMMPGAGGWGQGQDQGQGRGQGQNPGQRDLPPMDWQNWQRDRIDSPEIAFETRYFSVTFDKEGNITKTDTGMISAITEETAASYAQDIYNSSKTKGFVGEYRFLVSNTLEKGKLIVFCDCGASLANFRSFLKISLIISAVGLVLVSIVVALISGKAIKPVAESYEKQKRFITDAGHEIKTPLAIINADADVLEMDVGEENEWLTDIKRQTKRLADLTNDLILLSKMEEGGKTLVMENVDLSSRVSDQSESFRAIAVTGNKRFICDVDKGITIKGDCKAVDELISILLDNAVKYCPEGATVTVKLYRSSKSAILEVMNDTSEDIPEGSLKHLFDRFYRTDDSRNSESGGHGIGLSIAHAIVTAHGGKITAVKRGKKNIVFVASIPC